MDDSKLFKYKTAFCNRMLKNGVCRYDFMCDFAHNEYEIRRNITQNVYYPVYCEKAGCRDKNCMFSHNENEMAFHPEMYKTQLCHLYSTADGCPSKSYCPMAHGKHEIRISNWISTPSAGDTENIGGPAHGLSVVKEESSESLTLSDTEFQENNTFNSSTSTNHIGSPKINSTSPKEAITPPADISRTLGPNKNMPAHMAEKLSHAPPLGSMFPNSVLFNALTHNSNNFLHNYQYGQVNVVDPVIFQDECNSIKVKILDLMDNLCGMHYERAIIENERSKTLLMQDNAKLSTMLQEVQRQQKEALIHERRSKPEIEATADGVTGLMTSAHNKMPAQAENSTPSISRFNSVSSTEKKHPEPLGSRFPVQNMRSGSTSSGETFPRNFDTTSFRSASSSETMSRPNSNTIGGWPVQSNINLWTHQNHNQNQQNIRPHPFSNVGNSTQWSPPDSSVNHQQFYNSGPNYSNWSDTISFQMANQFPPSKPPSPYPEQQHN